jgi:hypothetical protein
VLAKDFIDEAIIRNGTAPVMPSRASDGAMHGPPPWAGGPG